MAESQIEFIYDEAAESSIRASLTGPRLGKYQREAGRDFDYAMSLYLWNARLCKALQFPLHAIEVTFRNAINEHVRKLGWDEDWAFSQPYLENLERTSRSAIDSQNRSKRRLLEDRMKKYEFNTKVRDVSFDFVPSFGKLKTDDVIASLPFEYWVSMLGGAHESDWHATLRTIFPNLPPSSTRRDIWVEADKIKNLRNRVAHHEPIFHLIELVPMHQSILELIGNKDLGMKDWVRHHSTLLQTWHSKPRRDGHKAGRKLATFAERIECVDNLDVTIAEVLEMSKRKRRDSLLIRHEGELQILTSDNITTWLRGCEEVGLADLSVSLKTLISEGQVFPRVEVVAADATTGMAHHIFHAAESKSKPIAIIITDNGKFDGVVQGAVFKPDFVM